MKQPKLKRWLIFGHGGYESLVNILLGIAPLYSALMLKHGYVKMFYETNNLFLVCIIATPLISYFALPTYMMFELKHILDKNQRVGEINNMSILFFSLQGLAGLLIQVYLVVQISHIVGTYATIPQEVILLVLSFLASYGGCLGVTDLALAPWPTWVWEHTKVILKSPKLIAVCIGTTILLYAISNITYNIIEKVGF